MKSSLLFLGTFLVCASRFTTAQANGVNGAQIIRVSLKSDDDKTKWDDFRNLMSLEVVHRSKLEADILVTASKLEETKECLESYNLQYKVLIDNVVRKINAQNPRPVMREATLRVKQGHAFTFTNYHSLKTINEYLNFLCMKYGSFVSMEEIGKTVLGRPLNVLKISSGKPTAPAIWIDGGIHAREWAAPAAVLYIISQLVEHRDKLPAKMKEHNYYILAVVNPDGYEYSRESSDTRLWRKNRDPEENDCIGVDLNRNFPYFWGGLGTSNVSCEDIFAGPEASSALETKAIVNFVSERIKEFKGSLTYHSYSQVILIPYGYDEVKCPDFDELKKVADIAASNIKNVTGAVYEVGNTANLMYPAAGGSDDWAKAQGIKYVFTVELRDTGADGFMLPASEIIPCGKDALEVVKAVAEAS